MGKKSRLLVMGKMDGSGRHAILEEITKKVNRGLRLGRVSDSSSANEKNNSESADGAYRDGIPFRVGEAPLKSHWIRKRECVRP